VKLPNDKSNDDKKEMVPTKEKREGPDELLLKANDLVEIQPKSEVIEVQLHASALKCWQVLLMIAALPRKEVPSQAQIFPSYKVRCKEFIRSASKTAELSAKQNGVIMNVPRR
jgi:hypothetical protein